MPDDENTTMKTCFLVNKNMNLSSSINISAFRPTCMSTGTKKTNKKTHSLFLNHMHIPTNNTHMDWGQGQIHKTGCSFQIAHLKDKGTLLNSIHTKLLKERQRSVKENFEIYISTINYVAIKKTVVVFTLRSSASWIQIVFI